MYSRFAVQRLLRKPLRCAAVLAAIALGSVTPAHAQTSQSAAFVVGNDRGGVVGTRAIQIQRLKAAGRRVEIRGRICLSSCTMFLGAGNVCVHPDTRFGFHGPSYYGRPLLPSQFEYWSEVLASHYPEPVAQWYMSTGRHSEVVRPFRTVLKLR